MVDRNPDGWRDAAVFVRGQTFAVSAHRTPGYGSFGFPPYFVVPGTATDEELGAAVNAAIDAFVLMEEVPSREVLDAAEAELHTLVGVRDGRSFERGTLYVHIGERFGSWTIQPWGRERGYWVPLKEDTFVSLEDPTPTEIGAGVRAAVAVLRHTA